MLRHRPIAGARRDLLILAAIVLLAALAELRFGPLDRLLSRASHTRSAALIQEILELALLVALALTVFAVRRWRDLAAIALNNARLYAQVREGAERYRMLIELSPEPMLVSRGERQTYANDAAVRLFHAASAADLIDRPVYDLIPEEFHEEARRLIRAGETTRLPMGPIDVVMQAVDGTTCEVELHTIPITYEDAPAALAVLHDITERKNAERRLSESEARYRLLFEGNPLPMWVYDTESLRFLAVNDAAVARYGYARDEFLAMTILDIRPPEAVPTLVAFLAVHTETYQPSGVWRHRRKDGTLVDMEITSYSLDFEGRPARLVVAVDVTERQRAEEQLRHLALHDALTGLPNRTLVEERLTRALDRSKRDPAYRYAVLYLDFDRFKTINDSLGHQEGDRVLIEGAHRLAGCVRSQDTLARLGGDEFVLLLEELADWEEPIAVAGCLRSALAAPIHLQGQDVTVSASIGVALGALHYRQPDELLRDADIAMYQAKMQGTGEPVVFDAMMHARAVARLFLEGELHRAVEQGEFTLHYQPIVALTTGAVTGFEALVRWRHPEIGLIAPAEFIPLAEETGLIVPLGRWVLREACRQLRAWDSALPAARGLAVSVNVSARELRQADFARYVTAVLREVGLAPHRLALEITESALIAEMGAAALRELHDAGVRIHLDDFGVGYSSLSYLQRFPLNALKIDRSFISGMGHAGIANPGIVQAIVAMAHQLGIAVTAEGIETVEQRRALAALGCDAGQGYLFGRSLTPAEAIVTIPNPATSP